MMRVAVPAAPDCAAIATGACETGAASLSTAMSPVGWAIRPLTRTTVPPLVRLVVPTRTWNGWPQCFAVTTQLALISEPPQECPPLLDCSDAMNE